MDRRAFLTKTLLSAALLAASGAAMAAPSVAPRDAIAPADPTENVWWYRRRWGWRRRYWGWHPWHRRYYYYW
jgi:hypothetical protein